MPYDEIARAASERGEVVLRRRRDGEDPDEPGVVELRVNGVFVMDTLETSTERELAAVALRQVEQPLHVLVGGLGLGFTAHEVLADPRVERVDVVEVEEALVGWMRDGTVPHGPTFLADERLHLVVADVRAAVAEVVPRSYDLVLLDVDNGPGHLVFEGNLEIYQDAFLSRLAEVLRPGGAVAVWSAAESKPLVSAMSRAFGTVTPVAYDVDFQGRSAEYYLYIGRP